jgi:seryl-tRNA synthetase
MLLWFAALLRVGWVWCAQNKGNADEVQEKSKELKKIIPDVEREAEEAAIRRDRALCKIGNLVHDSVPISNDEVRCKATS